MRREWDRPPQGRTLGSQKGAVCERCCRQSVVVVGVVVVRVMVIVVAAVVVVKMKQSE